MFRFSSLSSRSRRYFTGLDLGPTGIRLIQLSGIGSRQRQLEHYACASLPAGVINDTGIDDLALLIDTLRSLLESTALPARRVAFGIPADLIITTRQPIKADVSLLPDQLQALVNSLMADILPYPTSEAGIDFCTLPPVGADRQGSLFIAATRLEIIEDLLAMSEALGLQAIAVDISTYAAYAAWRQMESTAVIAAGQIAGLLHIDDMHMQCTLFDGPQALPEQTHDARASAANADAMALDALALVRKALAQTATTALTHLVLSGTGACMNGLSTALSQCMHPDTIVAPGVPRIRLATALNTEQWQEQAPAYLAAYGLALRSVSA